MSAGGEKESTSTLAYIKEKAKVLLKEKPVEPTNKKAQEAVKEKPKDYTKDQIATWVSSINSLLADSEGIKAFRKFLTELEVEPDEHTRYLDFWKECQDYKDSFQILEDKANNIFETYLEVGCEKEVGTGGKGVDIESSILKRLPPGKVIFNEAQEKVKQKLADHQYLNFCSYLKEKYKIEQK